MVSSVPESIDGYAAQHSTPLPDLLQELLATTEQRLGSRVRMISGQVEGLLLQTLAASLGARRILEVGMFTGFSALMMAAALPEDGELVTCEVNPEAIAIAQSFFARSPDGHKIQIRQGPALETLATLSGPFDFMFVDAEKTEYTAYYEAALPLLAPRGVMAVDNVLQRGRVLQPQDEEGHAVAAFNEHVRQDTRVTAVLLPLRDGVTLIRWNPASSA
jgi:caffeoyl-CoA O-methyltransferase